MIGPYNFYAYRTMLKRKIDMERPIFRAIGRRIPKKKIMEYCLLGLVMIK